MCSKLTYTETDYIYIIIVISPVISVVVTSDDIVVTSAITSKDLSLKFS